MTENLEFFCNLGVILNASNFGKEKFLSKWPEFQKWKWIKYFPKQWNLVQINSNTPKDYIPSLKFSIQTHSKEIFFLGDMLYMEFEK